MVRSSVCALTATASSGAPLGTLPADRQGTHVLRALQQRLAVLVATLVTVALSEHASKPAV
jgi:hypothetical protein